MASTVRSIWEKGDAEVARHSLLSLASADLNVSAVTARFREIKRNLDGALQTDIANNGTSYAEYIAAPGLDISGLSTALEELARSCWYLDQLRSGRFFFNKVKNLNAQINSYHKNCADLDRDQEIEDKLKEMFEPKEKRCYQTLHIHPDLGKVSLSREKTTLVICHHDAPFQKFFDGEKYKNRVAFLTLVDPAGLVRIRNHAKRLWAIKQVFKDMSKDDAQYDKAKDEQTTIHSELFLALRSLYARLFYPLGDLASGDTKLTDTTLLDNYQDNSSGQPVKFEGEKNTSKGELVIENTLRSVAKFHVVPAASGTDKIKPLRSLRTRVEQFLFPSSGRASWDQILDAAGSRGIMVWAEPGTLERMKDTLLTAGEWRELAGQLMKPPFVEEATVSIEYERNSKTGSITTTDIKLLHADALYLSEDGKPEQKIKHDEATVLNAMVLVFQARDSTNTNADGRPFRIENHITLKQEFLPGATPGPRTLKIGVVPVDATLKYTADGSDPANNVHTFLSKLPAGSVIVGARATAPRMLELMETATAQKKPPRLCRASPIPWGRSGNPARTTECRIQSA